MNYLRRCIRWKVKSVVDIAKLVYSATELRCIVSSITALCWRIRSSLLLALREEKQLAAPGTGMASSASLD